MKKNTALFITALLVPVTVCVVLEYFLGQYAATMVLFVCLLFFEKSKAWRKFRRRYHAEASKSRFRNRVRSVGKRRVALNARQALKLHMSAKEMLVADYLLSGQESGKEIAYQNHMSYEAVRKVFSRLYDRLGVCCREELIDELYRNCCLFIEIDEDSSPEGQVHEHGTEGMDRKNRHTPKNISNVDDEH